LYDGISNVGPAHYDFTSTLSATFADFNGVQGAFNPYMYNCNYAGCQDAVVYTSADLGGIVVAVTDLTSSNWGLVQYGHSQYYAIFTNTTVTFNTQVSWNNSCQYGPNQADARKVARHETGHVQGLGHTGYTAIMKQGDVCFNPMQLQPNDIAGLQTIYTGSITATTANG
jgi:predicted Zn-dependent protease